jgi:adenine-specific DNA-methyltransferase
MTQPSDLPPIAAVSTPDVNRERLDALKRLMPDLFSAEGRVNPDELRRIIESEGTGTPERYEFRWYGKAASKRFAFAPTTAALEYDAARSVNPDKAGGNVIIEGENLEVLKILLASYRDRVSCIYIDPPYNTGKDFVYSDDYSEGRKPYWEQTGVTESGVKVDTNTDSGGRYHSKWLTMMHGRLLLARQLLREDGILLVSIDDYEVHNLRRLLDEVFGAENFIVQQTWEKGRKNDAKLFSAGHEYMIVFARNRDRLRELGTVWREPKPGAAEIWVEYERLRSQHGDDHSAIEAALSEWFRQLPETHPSRKLSRYRRIDKHGPWRDRDISWPGGGGPRYDVLHPDTKLPCKVPERGWIYSKPEDMDRQIKLGLVVFRDDHTEPPFRKAHLMPVAAELLDDNGNGEADEPDADVEELATQVRGTCIYKQSQVSVKYLRTLLGGKVFTNPKDHVEIARLLAYVTSSDPNAVFVDFFAGSGTTAEAVIALNKLDGGSRMFVVAQLPELTDEASPAYKSGFKRISDITIERVKRVIAREQRDASDRLPTDPERQFADGLGFKVYRLRKSTFPRVEYAPDPAKTREENIEALKRYIADKEATMFPQIERDVIIDEILLKNGFMFDRIIERATELSDNEVFRVRDAFKSALVCLDPAVKAGTVAWFQKNKAESFICLELALDTTAKWNLRNALGSLFTAV